MQQDLIVSFAVEGTGSPTADYAGQGREQPNTGINAQLDYVATPKFFLSGKVSYLSYNDMQNGIPDELWYTFGAGSPATLRMAPVFA